MACNLLQIHVARASAWGPVYADLEAFDEEVEAYVRQMTLATDDVCAGRAGSDTFERRLARIERFRAATDQRTSALLDVPLESAMHLRLAALDAIDGQIWRECFAEPADAAGVLMGRLPLTPDVGAGLPVTPISEVLGNCSGGASGGGGSGAGAPPTLDVGTGLRATQACLTGLASQAAACDSPVGMSQEEARGRVQLADERCRSGAGSCSITTSSPAEDGSRSTNISYTGSEEDRLASFSVSFTEDADGQITEVEFQFQRRPGAREMLYEAGPVDPSTREAKLPRVLPTAVPSAPTSPTGAEAVGGAALSLLRTVAETVLRRAVAPRPSWPINQWLPGGRMQCETFAGGDSQPVGILRGPGASNPSSGVGPGVPGLINSDDAIAYCLCQGGAAGRQLAGAMGFGCPSPAGDYAKRMACFEARPDAQPPGECATFAEETGLDVAAMCASTVQCPEGSAATGTVVAGRLSCGCGRTGGPGGGRSNQCGAVTCPPPGSPMPASAEGCCATATPIAETPRAVALRDLRVRFRGTPVEALALPAGVDERLRDRDRLRDILDGRHLPPPRDN